MKTDVRSVANHRDIIKRKKNLKNELKIIILKSLLQNRESSRSLRSFFRLKLAILWKKNYSKSNQQNICILSGKKKTTFKLTSLSRQYTKRMIEHGLIQNVRIK